jgi:hypothetical protein
MLPARFPNPFEQFPTQSLFHRAAACAPGQVRVLEWIRKKIVQHIFHE